MFHNGVLTYDNADMFRVNRWNCRSLTHHQYYGRQFIAYSVPAVYVSIRVAPHLLQTNILHANVSYYPVRQ